MRNISIFINQQYMYKKNVQHIKKEIVLEENEVTCLLFHTLRLEALILLRLLF